MTDGIRSFNKLFDVDLTVDTNAYAVNDVLAAAQEITNVFPDSGVEAILQSVVAIDYDDQGKDFDIIFLDKEVSFGDENAACDPTDAAASHILAVVSMTSWTDLINCQVAQEEIASGDEGMGMVLEPSGTNTSLWVAAIAREIATYAGGVIKLRIGLKRG